MNHREYMKRAGECKKILKEILPQYVTPVSKETLFKRVKQVSWDYTTDVIQFTIISLLDDGYVDLTSDYKIKVNR